MLSTAGAKVSKSENDKMKRKLEDVFRQLQTMEKDKNLSSRIRFILRDVIVSLSDVDVIHYFKRHSSLSSERISGGMCPLAINITCSFLLLRPPGPEKEQLGASSRDLHCQETR